MLAVDVDDTILRRVPGAHLDWNDAHSLLEAYAPHEDALEALVVLGRLHGGVAYVTGRCHDVPGMEAVTRRQLAEAGAPPGAVILQPEWRGWDAFAWWKAWAIVHVGATAYVGDAEADRVAAERAGVQYVGAEVLHAMGHGLRSAARVNGAGGAARWLE